MKKLRSGFTLIELLVVISLIGILTTLVFANLNSARQRGRDAQRKSDLRNIQTALRLYFNDKSAYPASDGSGGIVGCGAGAPASCIWGGNWSLGNNTYMSVLPKDPLAAQSYQYVYVDADNYTLSACLENKSDDKGVGMTVAWCPTSWVYQVKP